MLSRGMIFLLTFLLSSCAYMDGLRYQQDSLSSAPNKQKKVINPSSSMNAEPANNQNNPESNIGKMIRPLT
ncbi:MAG: hypothetical protein K0S27_1142 [Gammaproteobacteria bacterium]|jgi:hypothetical protein|nr:hypothetical protein [Gammaproteobacteria bacterium]